MEVSFLAKEMKFCDLLSDMLKDYKKPHEVFYTELGIKKSYFYDILGGRVSPPPSEKQFKMIKIFKPTPEICEEFFELAAEERDEMPADLRLYINKSMRKSIRKSQDYKDMMNSIIKR